MARMKTEKAFAPRTIEEAERVLSTIGTLQKAAADLSGEKMAEMTKTSKLLDEIFDDDINRLTDRAKKLAIGLKSFCEANPDAFNRERSHLCEYGSFGFRKTPEKVVIPKAEMTTVIDWLLDQEGLASCVNVTAKIDKNALKAFAADERQIIVDNTSVTFSTVIEFFVDPKLPDMPVEHPDVEIREK